MTCTKDHTNLQFIMSQLPDDQGGNGRHKCAACAYEKGFNLGRTRIQNYDMETIINNLPESQAGEQRHKSPYQAFTQGLNDGMKQSY